MRRSENPCNFTYDDCVRVLLQLGFVQANTGGGSHRRFIRQRPGSPPAIVSLVDKGTGPIKRWYVSDMLEVLQAHGLLPTEEE